MKNEEQTHVFEIRNLMCMKDIVLGKEDIFNIAKYAIENGIVNITFELMNETESVLTLKDTKIWSIYLTEEEQEK